MHGGNIAPSLLNIFRPPGPRLRIRLRYGDLDLAFDPVATVLGKKQRLQALGWYYEVIVGAAAGNNVTEAYTNCLAAWRRNRERTLGAPFANDAALEADMQARIRNFVVENGVLPAPGAMVQVMVPGALTFNNSADLGRGGAPPGPLPAVRFNDEGTMWANNAALGRIPLIATVEEDQNGTWVVSPNRMVHFQLIPAFHEAPAQEFSWVNTYRNQSEQGTAIASNIVAGVGPRPYVTAAMNTSSRQPIRNVITRILPSGASAAWHC